MSVQPGNPSPLMILIILQIALDKIASLRKLWTERTVADLPSAAFPRPPREERMIWLSAVRTWLTLENIRRNP